MCEIGAMWQTGVLIGKVCTSLVQNGSFWAFWHHKIRRLLRGSDVKWHFPSTCLDASKKSCSFGIYSVDRASEWLWLETRETLKMAKLLTVSRLPCTHFEIPSEDFFWARKSRIRHRFVIHAEIPGSGIRN